MVVEAESVRGVGWIQIEAGRVTGGERTAKFSPVPARTRSRSRYRERGCSPDGGDAEARFGRFRSSNLIFLSRDVSSSGLCGCLFGSCGWSGRLILVA